jgi:hypothetical protein
MVRLLVLLVRFARYLFDVVSAKRYDQCMPCLMSLSFLLAARSCGILQAQRAVFQVLFEEETPRRTPERLPKTAEAPHLSAWRGKRILTNHASR